MNFILTLTFTYRSHSNSHKQLKGMKMMFNELTTEHCMYTIRQNDLDQFISLAASTPLEGYVHHAKSLNPLNNYAIVLQIWCFLNEDCPNGKFYLKTEKTLPYTVDRFILGELAKIKELESYKKTIRNDERMLYIYAFHLGCATLTWGDAVIHQLHNAEDVFSQANSYDYFNEDITFELDEAQLPFHFMQKRIVQAMIQSIAETNAFILEIQRAISKTRAHSLQTKL